MNKEDLQKILPYAPQKLEIIYVKADNVFMKKAARILNEGTGCAKQPTAAVIVQDRIIIGSGSNASKRVDICPRVEHNCPTGQGYEFCREVCKQKGHAEVIAIQNAKENGFSQELVGASLYLDGHWWACKNCCDTMEKAGIIRLYLREDSMELYKK